ncbi:MAG: fructosamine kinase family protein [Bacteroidota bacterium]
MLKQEIKNAAESILQSRLNPDLHITHTHVIGGGSINAAWKIDTNQETTFFLKHNHRTKFPGMFEKEEQGLKLMRETNTIHIPEVIGVGNTQEDAFILMEYISTSKKTSYFWSHFAKNLAKMHQNSDDQYGLDHDNYMGSLQQHNKRHTLWYDFFILERLEPQLHLARNKGLMNHGHVQQFEQLYKELQNLIPQEKPALVHGDLYSGNFVVNQYGEASILDPAVAYNHREVDIAMSTLFGKFDAEFYQTYQQYYPMEKGWEDRLDIYNLYPLLIHVNLFGMGYLSSVERIIKDF